MNLNDWVNKCPYWWKIRFEAGKSNIITTYIVELTEEEREWR